MNKWFAVLIGLITLSVIGQETATPVTVSKETNAETIKNALAQAKVELDQNRPAMAFSHYMVAAKAGSKEAMFAVGQAFAQGAGVAKSLDIAATWYGKAAEAGYPEAQYQLARCYESGLGVPTSPNLAEEWMKKAARLGQGDAAIYLAERLVRDDPSLEANQKAIAVLQPAVSREDPAALHAYALLLLKQEKGKLPESTKEAIQLLQQSESKGFGMAALRLGVMHLNGEIPPGDPVQARDHFAKSSQLNTPGGHAYFAHVLEQGIGGAADPEQALQLFKRAVDAGVDWAQPRLTALRNRLQTPKLFELPIYQATRQQVNRFIGGLAGQPRAHDLQSLYDIYDATKLMPGASTLTVIYEPNEQFAGEFKYVFPSDITGARNYKDLYAILFKKYGNPTRQQDVTMVNSPMNAVWQVTPDIGIALINDLNKRQNIVSYKILPYFQHAIADLERRQTQQITAL